MTAPADSTTEVWLARHGETEWSRTRRHTGLTDIELTAAGEEEARALRPRLAGVEFDRVVSSPLRRAQETARLAGFDPEADPRLVEWDYGDYEGITTAEIRQTRPDWYLWDDGCPGGESPADVEARMTPLALDLAESRGRVLVFAHGHSLRSLAGCWLGLGVAGGRYLKLGTGGLSALGFEHGRPTILRWNA